jgi:hypothetical protein
MLFMGINLLKNNTTEMARLPFVIGAFLTLLVEMLVEQKWFSVNQIGISILIVGIIATICLNPSTPNCKKTITRGD